MADCKSGCSGSCSSGCKNSCKNSCKDGCKNTCKNGCKDGCKNTCKNGCGGECSSSCTYSCKNSCKGCTGTCEGSCHKGCTNNCVSACSSTCNKTCEGNCYTGCTGSCYKECSGACKGYCASICQTYCQKAQTFTENLSPISNAIGKPKFSWSNPVKAATKTEQASTIQITAKEWNTLKEYIKAATKYCGGTSPSGANASNDPESLDNLISAAKYNDLANGLGLTNVKANETLISADLINALQNTYNSRKIINTLPNGEKPLTGNKNNCCQKGQTCMASGELLSHQKKTEKCKDQTTSSCGGQSPGS